MVLEMPVAVVKQSAHMSGLTEIHPLTRVRANILREI